MTCLGLQVKEVALSQFPRCFQNNTGHDGNGIGVGPDTPFGGPGDERNKTVSLMSMSDCHWVRRNAIGTPQPNPTPLPNQHPARRPPARRICQEGGDTAGGGARCLRGGAGPTASA